MNRCEIRMKMQMKEGDVVGLSLASEAKEKGQRAAGKIENNRRTAHQRIYMRFPAGPEPHPGRPPAIQPAHPIANCIIIQSRKAAAGSTCWAPSSHPLPLSLRSAPPFNSIRNSLHSKLFDWRIGVRRKQLQQPPTAHELLLMPL